MPKTDTQKMSVSGTIGDFRVSIRELQGIADTTVFWFTNKTNDAMTLIFPTTDVFGFNFIEIPAGLTFKSKTQSSTAKGIYEYQVFCHEGQEFAHASVPVIIIYPKRI